MGNGVSGYFKDLPARLEELGPVVKQAGDRADKHACEAIKLLREIRNAVQNLYGANAYEFPRLPFDAAGVKTIEGREGYAKTVKRIAVTGAGAADVDVFVGDVDTGFQCRVSLAAAGRTSTELDIPCPEGSPLFVQASAAAQVNLIVQRIEL